MKIDYKVYVQDIKKKKKQRLLSLSMTLANFKENKMKIEPNTP